MNTRDCSLLATTTFALIFACGGGQSEPRTADATAKQEATGETQAPPALEAWDESATDEQKAAFMAAKVVPALAPIFQAQDPDKHADFGCATCHGVDEPEHEEPADHLPRLKAVDGNITAFADHPEEAQFMAQKVVPAMAAALGVEPYDVSTGKGFGCNGCHAVDM